MVRWRRQPLVWSTAWLQVIVTAQSAPTFVLQTKVASRVSDGLQPMLMLAGQLVKAGPLGPLVTVIRWLQVMELLHKSVTFQVRIMMRLVGQTPPDATSVKETVTGPQPSAPVA